MLDLFLKLIEKLIDLANESKKVRRALHDDFVLPAMEQFEAVHKEYILSFQAYRDMVVSQSPAFTEDNPVFKKLESDMIFSHSSREKLRAMSEGLLPFIEEYSWSHENKINRFIHAMVEYVFSILNSAGGRYSNKPRESLVKSLERIAAGDRFHQSMVPAQEAEREILEKIWEMQDRYMYIQNSYQESKTELLK